MICPWQHQGHLHKTSGTHSRILICLGICTTLLFFAEWDVEIGDHHADRLKRRAYGLSIYVSIRVFSGTTAAIFAMIMIPLSRMSRSLSAIYFSGVVAWIIISQAFLFGIVDYRRRHPVPVTVGRRISQHQALLTHVDATCGTKGNGSINIGFWPVAPSTRVLERAAYYLGSRWGNIHPTNGKNAILSHQFLPLFYPQCFEESQLQMIELPVCFALQRWEGNDGDAVLGSRLIQNGPSSNLTTFESLLYTRYADLVTLADMLRGMRSRQGLEGITVPLRFGDGFLHDESIPFPVLVQALLFWPRDTTSLMGPASVLWPMHRARYYGSLFEVLKNDITPFALKRDVAIWRGVTTGDPKGYGFPKGQKPSGRPIQRAALVRRLSENFGLWNGNTSVLDVGVTQYVQGAREKLVDAGFVPVDEVPFLPDAQVLRAKMIIIAEGNDASTGLKWALFSTSAVLMPPPTVATWIMEDQLEPWVHYVPLAQDFSDLLEKTMWCIANVQECEAIGIAGRCFMHQFMDEDVENAVEYVVLQRVVAELRKSGSNRGSVCEACFARALR